MSNLKNIRSRLRSVENIKKITDTMERVAAARLRQAQEKAEQSRPYIQKMQQILEKIAETEVIHPLFEPRVVKKIGVIIVTADKGLCGAYNTNIIHKANAFLKKYEPEQIELILVGRKAIDYYSRRNYTIKYELPGWAENLSFHNVALFSDQLVNRFLSKKTDEVWLIYTHFVSVMQTSVVIEKFLNIGKNLFEKKKEAKDPSTKKSENYIFEPGPTEILSDILPRYCVTRIQTVFYESYASELAARIMAMQTASKNSEEMIEDLTMIKNKTRQRDITREMIEITSASNL